MSSAFLTDPVVFSVAVGSDLATLPHDMATWGAAHFVLMFIVLMFASIVCAGTRFTRTGRHAEGSVHSYNKSDSRSSWTKYWRSLTSMFSFPPALFLEYGVT